MRRVFYGLRPSTWTSRNRRNILVMITFASALILLAWKKPAPIGTNDTEPVLRFFPQKGYSEVRADKIRYMPLRASVSPYNDSYPARVQHVINTCAEAKGPSWSPVLRKVPTFSASPIISTKYSLLFCPVGKVASSYFTRFVLAMNKPGPMTSPYDIPISQAGRNRAESLQKLKERSGLLFLQKSTKIVFGRNPYSRIFSAYIDKVYSPNPFYWKKWGDKALKYSGVAKSSIRPCASDLTFQQFVAYVVHDLYKSDVHLRPVFEECKMCDVIYDVVGKLETTTHDIDHLAEVFNISSAFQYSPDYPMQAALDTVLDSIESAFSWKRDIKACMPLNEMGARIWRKLQIRGVIDSHIPYPFKDGREDIATMRAERFISECKKAMKSSTDKVQLKRQKEQAFLEAYSALSVEEIEKIALVYSNEFSAFNYDKRPAKLFENRDQVKHTDYLNVKKEWVVL